MSLQSYDLLKSIFTGLCGILGLAYILITGDTIHAYFGWASFVALAATLCYLSEMPKLISLDPSSNEYEVKEWICLVFDKISYIAIVVQSVFIMTGM